MASETCASCKRCPSGWENFSQARSDDSAASAEGDTALRCAPIPGDCEGNPSCFLEEDLPFELHGAMTELGSGVAGLRWIDGGGAIVVVDEVEARVVLHEGVLRVI